MSCAKSITTVQLDEIEQNRRTSVMKRAAARINTVARWAAELQRTVPGLGRTEALMLAEDFYKEKQT